jgi:glycosyltransferase involved in cell wall biosynthesis
MTSPLISVCVASVRSDTLPYTVESIRRQTLDRWELIIVGQGDDMNLRAYGESIRRQDSRVHYLHLTEKGCSLARNLAIRSAESDLVVTTDDDCEAREDWLATIVGCFEAEPATGVLGGALLKPIGSRRFLSTCPAVRPAETLYDPVTTGPPGPAGWGWVGANVAMRRDVIELAGVYDEQLGPGSPFPAGEDLDYLLRLERLGVRMRCTPRSVVFHTFGYRYGLKALLRQSRNYARGNGGLAGKLTLLGDPRGAEWVENTRGQCLDECLKPLRLHRLALNLWRLKIYQDAYRDCVRDFEIDVERRLLRPADRRLPSQTAAITTA